MKIILPVLLIASTLLIGCGRETVNLQREGIVKFNDCREIIKLEDNAPEKNYMTFTCDYIKSNTGKIMAGTCVHIETSNDGKECTKAYTYYAKPELKCEEGLFPTIYDTCEHGE